MRSRSPLLVTEIRFASLPSKGTVYRQSGRDYVSVNWEPYIRKDGGESLLIEWEGRCKACGAAFRTKSGLVTKGLPANCEKHRRRR